MIKGEIVDLKIFLIAFLLPGFLSGVLPVTADGPFMFISFSTLAFYIQWCTRVHSRRLEFVLRTSFLYWKTSTCLSSWVSFAGLQTEC